MNKWSHLKEWAVFVFLAFFLGAGIVYSQLHDPNAGANKIRIAAILGCQRGVAKAQIFKEFTDKAAEARRTSAAAEESAGNLILANNDLATARSYESIGNRWVKLTPNNCEEQYPKP